MDKKTLKSLPLTAFNEEGWLKPPLWIYINLIFMAKGILIYIASIASRGIGDKVMALMYPEKIAFYIALALSLVPFITLVSLTLGKLQDNLKIKKALLLLCIVEIASEMVFAIKFLLSTSQSLYSTTFKLLILQVFLLLFAALSKEVIAFFKQIIDEKAILKD